MKVNLIVPKYSLLLQAMRVWVDCSKNVLIVRSKVKHIYPGNIAVLLLNCTGAVFLGKEGTIGMTFKRIVYLCTGIMPVLASVATLAAKRIYCTIENH